MKIATTMPMNSNKRKAITVTKTESALSGLLPSQKRGMTIKSAEGFRSMGVFLNEMYAHDIETNAQNSDTLSAIRQSPMLVNAMLRCHERFVRIVASELVLKTTSLSDAEETSTTIHRVGEHHVQNALKELGMHDIYAEMKQIQQSVRSATNKTEVSALPSKKIRKNERRVKQWTEEEIIEQELLLSSSKEKFLRGGC